MDLKKFWEMMKDYPQQNPMEWMVFLEWVETYFKNRKIQDPMVIELGVRRGNQKHFWTDLMGYGHIGIDKREKYNPDLVGDTHDVKTRDRAIEMAGREINLVFIDADHRYESAVKDFRIWGPLATHLIVFHDVKMDYVPFVNVSKFWNELVNSRKARHTTMTLFTHRARFKRTKNNGLGIIIKWEKEACEHELFTYGWENLQK